jgi:trehalose 6-phosphate synthase/phosphatase
MLGANLVCFQTYSYTRHFTSTCVRVCGYETTSRTIQPPSAGASRSGTISRGASLTRGVAGKGKGVLGAEKYVGIDVQGHVATVTHCPVGVDAERVAKDT